MTDYSLTHRPWDDLKPRVRYLSRSDDLEMTMRLAAHIPGNVIEFGVASGSSMRAMQSHLRRLRRWPINLFPNKQFFALDSFEGLRETYENAPVGAFKQDPPHLPGANIVKGYFEDSCTPELARQVGRVALAHLDADLYSSTLFALRWLTPLLGTGSLLLFDEFVGAKQSEARAFTEWREETGTELVRIAEFDRDPSGWGSTPDRRLLYQVVGDEPLPVLPRTLRQRVAGRLMRG